MLLDLQSTSQIKNELDLKDEPQDNGKLMGVLDGLNQRYGKGTVILGSSGTMGDKREWSMKQERRTPAYTTNWEDMPTARA